MKTLLVFVSILSLSVSAQESNVAQLLSKIDSSYKKIEKNVEKDVEEVWFIKKAGIF